MHQELQHLKKFFTVLYCVLNSVALEAHPTLFRLGRRRNDIQRCWEFWAATAGLGIYRRTRKTQGTFLLMWCLQFCDITPGMCLAGNSWHAVPHMWADISGTVNPTWSVAFGVFAPTFDIEVILSSSIRREGWFHWIPVVKPLLEGSVWEMRRQCMSCIPQAQLQALLTGWQLSDLILWPTAEMKETCWKLSSARGVLCQLDNL